MIEIKDTWLSLRTQRFNEMADFYQQLVGEPFRYKPQRHAYFRVGSVTLVLWHDPQASAQMQTLQLVVCVGHLERSLQDLPESWLVSSVRQESHGQEVDFADPDGNRIIMYRPANEITLK